MDATKQRMKVAAKAAQWWVAMQDNPPMNDRGAYIAWLRSSPVHVAEILRLCQLHAKLERSRRAGHIPTDAAIDRPQASSPLIPRGPAARSPVRALISVGRKRQYFRMPGVLVLTTLIALTHRA